MDEQALIHDAQGGSLAAFNTLVLHYQDSIFNTALRILGDDDLAADATQEAFLSAFKSISSFRGGSFRTYNMSYKAYLEKVGITPGMYTSRMNNLVNNYLNWINENQITIEDTSYKELMNFIGHMQTQGKSKHHINRTLQSISHYYQYKGLPNIAQTTRIKGVPRTQPQNLVDCGRT